MKLLGMLMSQPIGLTRHCRIQHFPPTREMESSANIFFQQNDKWHLKHGLSKTNANTIQHHINPTPEDRGSQDYQGLLNREEGIYRYQGSA